MGIVARLMTDVARRSAASTIMGYTHASSQSCSTVIESRQISTSMTSSSTPLSLSSRIKSMIPWSSSLSTTYRSESTRESRLDCISPFARSSRRNLSTSSRRSCRRMIKRPITTARAEEDGGRSPDLAIRNATRKLSPGLESVLPPSLATKITFRPSKREDCAAILEYLRAHAQWEDCQEEFELTEDDLIRDGFEGTPCFQCDVAEAHGKDDVTSVIGYALYNLTYCAWKGKTLQWENIFIHPYYREYGIGATFFHKVCKKHTDSGCRTIAGYVDANEMELVRWYEGLGFENITRKCDYQMYCGRTKENPRVARFLRDGDPSARKAKLHGIQIE